MADLRALRARVEAAQALAAKAPAGPYEWSVYASKHNARLCTEAQFRADDGYLLELSVDRVPSALADLLAAAPDLVTLATDLLVALEAAQAERDEARARAMRAEDAKKAAATAAAMDERAAIALWLERNNPIPGWQASPGGTKIGDYLASLFRRGVHRG